MVRALPWLPTDTVKVPPTGRPLTGLVLLTNSHPLLLVAAAPNVEKPLVEFTVTEVLGKLPLLVMKENGMVDCETVQLPLPPPPTVKFTVIASGVPAEGVTVTVP